MTIQFSGTAGMVSVSGQSYTWNSAQTKMHLELSSDKDGNKLWSSLKIEGQDDEDATEEATEDDTGGPDESSGDMCTGNGSQTCGKQIRPFYLLI